jgi:uncharacterized protein (TIGR02145 family)
MYKLFISVALTSVLFSCKKETATKTSTQTVIKQGLDINDVEGNSYKTVTIGTQTWMAENLKVSKYNDGTDIPNITDKVEWQNNTTGAWSYFYNTANNNAKFGKLYNWYALSKATNGNKNVCPEGWHVPSDAEWTVITDYLGGNLVAGGKMKEVGIKNWDSPNIEATNVSLFTALPGGTRDSNGYFSPVTSLYDYSPMGIIGSWWSSSESNANNARYLYLGSVSQSSYRNNDNKKKGFSVRCLRD